MNLWTHLQTTAGTLSVPQKKVWVSSEWWVSFKNCAGNLKCRKQSEYEVWACMEEGVETSVRVWSPWPEWWTSKKPLLLICFFSGARHVGSGNGHRAIPQGPMSEVSLLQESRDCLQRPNSCYDFLSIPLNNMDSWHSHAGTVSTSSSTSSCTSHIRFRSTRGRTGSGGPLTPHSVGRAPSLQE